jgi:Bacterial aa3 type cytochrome c oxidase subunit IV
MASHSDHHDDDYVHGQMDTTAQTGMYQAFLVASQWGCVLIGAMVACMALIWGADVEWLQAVLGCGALAIGAGLGMNMGGSFTITAVVLTLIGLVSGGISTLVSMIA